MLRKKDEELWNQAKALVESGEYKKMKKVKVYQNILTILFLGLIVWGGVELFSDDPTPRKQNQVAKKVVNTPPADDPDREKRKAIYDNNNFNTKYYVVKPKVNVRNKPVNGKIVHTQRDGNILQLLNKEGDWGKFKYVYSSDPEKAEWGLGEVYEGWIHLGLVESHEQRIQREEKELGRKVVRYFSMDNNSDMVNANKAKHPKERVLVACQEGIRKQAKFPDKIDFPFLEGYTVLEKGWGYIINGKAEMMNGLGLMIPARYKCTFDLREGKLTEARIL